MHHREVIVGHLAVLAFVGEGEIFCWWPRGKAHVFGSDVRRTALFILVHPVLERLKVFFTRVLQGAKQQLIVIQEGSGCYNEVRLVTSWGFAAYQLQQFHFSPWSFRKFFGAKKRWNPRILVNVHPVDAEIQIPILTLRCKQKPPKWK